jgi:hypothetical protein
MLRQQTWNIIKSTAEEPMLTINPPMANHAVNTLHETNNAIKAKQHHIT